MLPPYIDTGAVSGIVLLNDIPVPLEYYQFTPHGIIRRGGNLKSETRLSFVGVLQRLSGWDGLTNLTLQHSSSIKNIPELNWQTFQSGNDTFFNKKIIKLLFYHVILNLLHVQ